MPRCRTRNKTVLNMGVTAGIRMSGGRPPASSGKKRGRSSGAHAGDATSGQLPTASAELLPSSASSAASEVSVAGGTEVPRVVMPTADTAYDTFKGLAGGSTGELTGQLPLLFLAQEGAPTKPASAAAGTPSLQPQGGDACVRAEASNHPPHLEHGHILEPGGSGGNSFLAGRLAANIASRGREAMTSINGGGPAVGSATSQGGLLRAITSGVGATHAASAAAARKLPMVTCPICNRELPEESISRHVDTCLRQKSSQDSRAQREQPLRAEGSSPPPTPPLLVSPTPYLPPMPSQK